VSPTSRRIFSYWILLLVPTLVVGGGAIQLLRREEARLMEQNASATEARRAASTARARLIAENVELLVGDVEDGLLDALSTAPVTELDSFLAQWEQKNPLVRIAFRAMPDGHLLRPNAAAANEEARGFVRRFQRAFVTQPPWLASSAIPEADAKLAQKVQIAEPVARKEVASNVAQVQSARRDVQELLKSRDYLSDSNTPAASAGSPASRSAEGSSSYSSAARADTERARQSPQTAVNRRANPARLAAASPKKDSAERRGWTPFTLDGRLHLLGWVQATQTDEVRGVEVETVALVSRLAGALPAEIGAGEGYALRDAGGRVLHQIGSVPRADSPALRVPLSDSLLPGWDVVAYFAATPIRSADATGFFWVGVLIVAIFVVAILAGGSLLWWQARRSEAEAAQKTSFVANVSHEFKTPLTTIRLYAELLEQGRVKSPAQSGEYLQTIGRETQRLARLVNNALDFSRLEQGRKKFALEPVDLTAELTRLLDTLGPRLSEAGLKLQRALPAGPLTISVDRDALEQILLNVIDNACKYAASGGEVSVSAIARPNGGVELRVADRGPGVPAAHRERIFEKFHRVDEALTAEKSGAGLGLSIARQLARGLGGDLRYAPRSGGGSEFILELP
jgi:two-component system, OmpR family, phosphate regulon sensor histidine kinase PhoR